MLENNNICPACVIVIVFKCYNNNLKFTSENCLLKGSELIKWSIMYSINRTLNSMINILRQRCYHSNKYNKSKENAAARETMRSLNKYSLWPSADRANLPKSTTNNQVIAEFRSIAMRSSPRSVDMKGYHHLYVYKRVISAAKTFNCSQILEVLNAFTLSKAHTNSKSIVELRESLNNICVLRCADWSTQELLQACDIWYQIPLGRVKFVQLACESLASQSNHLTPSQLIQTLFYVNWLRQPCQNMQRFEKSLLQHIDKLTVDELAIAAMGFYKSDTKIQSTTLVRKLYERLLAEELQSVTDISLSCMLKVFFVRKQDYTISISIKFHI